MITFPKAKINFGLRITGKRSDGFHEIETIFYPIGLCDALEFVVAKAPVYDDQLVVSGFKIGTSQDNNLVIKAVRKIRENFPLPFLKVHLHKAIPAGAGLGGGSSDAACMLRTLNRYFDCGLSYGQLKSYALELGSDCPFFIECTPSLARGRGEILSAVKPFLEGYHIILVNPGISISTREAYLYTSISQSKKELAKVPDSDPDTWKKMISNDFEDFAFNLHPGIADLKRTLYRSGAVFSSMTGSGSSVYGIFRTKPGISEKLRKFVIYEGLL
jgi:4-diphosphocytidyl-2-C-methyl-D-erythritol kinase